METCLALAAIIIPSIISLMQLCRTPKPKLEPKSIKPASLIIIGVPMNHGRDLPGYRL